MLPRNGRSRINWTRWQRAQEYEQGFWERLADEIETGATSQLDWYEWRGSQLEQRLASAGVRRRPGGRVLEIGSGPIGIVNFVEGGQRYAIDPLEQFYRRKPSLVQLRRPGSIYLPGTGERLPFEDRSFSLVIVDNVIDHTYAPGLILDEVRRVLEPRGHLYLCVNAHTAWGAALHALLAALRIDKGHPYTFTSRRLRRLLASHGFTVLLEEVEDYARVKQADRQSARPKDKVKGYTGLSEFQHAVLCQADGRDAATVSDAHASASRRDARAPSVLRVPARQSRSTQGDCACP